MESHAASLLRGEQHAHVITGDTTMLTSKGKAAAKATTKLRLTTAVAACSIAAVTFAGAAVASARPTSAASAPAGSALEAQVQLLRECEEGTNYSREDSLECPLEGMLNREQPVPPASAPHLAHAPAPTTTPKSPPPSATNPLEGKPLRYLIGTDIPGLGREGEITEVSYSAIKPTARGISVKYCNLFDEENTGRYGPYLHTSDTAAQYNEGQIDPAGPGWTHNLQDQYERATAQKFEYIELDNADAYHIANVLGAVEAAQGRGLKVIAKNPLLLEGAATAYLAHPNVFGVIVERGAGGPIDTDALRKKAGKPNLPVWFVAFGDGRTWAGNVANAARPFRNMSVTYSSACEYGNSIDLLRLDRAPS